MLWAMPEPTETDHEEPEASEPRENEDEEAEASEVAPRVAEALPMSHRVRPCAGNRARSPVRGSQ